MDTTKLKAILVAMLAMFVALYLGISAATAQFETIAWILGGAVLITCVLLGRRIWLLIPFLGALNLTLRIPGQPNTLLIAQILFLGFAVLLLLMRKLPFRLMFTELEFWVFILTLFVAQVYMRNPVSISIFGGSTVGGKAYYIFAISLVSAIFLGGLRVPVSEMKAMLRLTIAGGILNIMMVAAGMIIPQLGFWYGAVGGGFGESAIEANTVQGVGSDRGAVTQNVTFSSIGPNIALWVSAFISPLKACFSLRWAPLLLLACGIAAMSGYRNAIAALGLTILLGIWYRGGLGSVLASAFMGVLGVAMLALVNSALPLPPNVQRSLAFLPGTWEDRYVQSTQDSTDWRMEIWKEVLLTDRWIQNKWFGDGLGYTAQELAMQMNVMEQKNKGRFGVSGFDSHRETILANGDYHSGPVQTIRTIGYLGLAALLLAQIRLAMHAHRQIQRCRNTEWFPLALLVGIPLVWAPIFFVFIFGTFKEGASAILMGYGMIRLLQNNLPLPAHVRARRVPYIPRTRPLLAEATLAEH